MTNAEYERLYAVGDILRHIRAADWQLKKAGPLEADQAEKVRKAVDGLQATLEETDQ